MHFVRMGQGPPVLLVHGLGGTWRSWETILPALAAEREVIAIDLPGFGRTPPLEGEVTIAGLADAIADFIGEHGLDGIPAAGTSMGARLVLELARRGVVGSTVALDPGGFWGGWGRVYLAVTLGLSIRLVRALGPVLPEILASPVGRTLLLAQFSARPWRLSPDVVLRELRSYAAAPSFDAALRALVRGPAQEGLPRESQRAPVVIAWGRRDRVTLPGQAARAKARFPGARLEWIDRCGHFPHWDRPEVAARLILDNSGSGLMGRRHTAGTAKAYAASA
jgi:pimeloyl-ACP methyl ester carboxylesterase